MSGWRLATAARHSVVPKRAMTAGSSRSKRKVRLPLANAAMNEWKKAWGDSAGVVVEAEETVDGGVVVDVDPHPRTMPRSPTTIRAPPTTTATGPNGPLGAPCAALGTK